MVLGVIVALGGLREWMVNERAVREGRPLRAPRLALLVTVVIAVIGVLALVVSLVWGTA